MAWDDSDEDDWEADDIDQKLALPGAGKKDPDEEQWSDEEGHDAHKKEDPVEAQKAMAAAAPAPPKPKTGLALKIEQREKREAEEKERKEALRKKLQESRGSSAIEISDDMDEATKAKLLRKQQEEEADLDNAIDAFGLGDDNKKEEVRPDPTAPGAGAFEALTLKVEKDFEMLARIVNQKLAPHEGTKNHVAALKALLRGATDNMNSEDCKDLNNFLSVISNAKLAADREKDKQKKNISKKKGKFAAAAANARAADDDDAFGGRGGGDFDDFM